MILGNHRLRDLKDFSFQTWANPVSLKPLFQSIENLPSVFGSNPKAHIAAKTVFHLAHRHGDILREGWKNIMEAMLQLFRAQLLPKAMVEVILDRTFSINKSKA